MPTIKQFEDMDLWQQAKALGISIYKATSDGPISKDFYLRDQIRRSALSISANIAEGFERNGNKEFMQFLYIAKASCGELRSHLSIAAELSLIKKEDYKVFKPKCEELSKMLQAFISYLAQSGLKGPKYKRN